MEETLLMNGHPMDTRGDFTRIRFNGVVHLNNDEETEMYIRALESIFSHLMLTLQVCQDERLSFDQKSRVISQLEERTSDLDTLVRLSEGFHNQIWDASIKKRMEEKQMKLRLTADLLKSQMKQTPEHQNPSHCDMDKAISMYNLVFDGWLTVLVLNVEMLQLADQHKLNDILRSGHTAILSLRQLKDIKRQQKAKEDQSVKELRIFFDDLESKLEKRILVSSTDEMQKLNFLNSLQTIRNQRSNITEGSQQMEMFEDQLTNELIKILTAVQQPPDFNSCFVVEKEITNMPCESLENVLKNFELLRNATEKRSDQDIVSYATSILKDIQCGVDHCVEPRMRGKYEDLWGLANNFIQAIRETVISITAPTVPNTTLTSLTTYETAKQKLYHIINDMQYIIKGKVNSVNINETSEMVMRAITGLYHSHF